MFFPEKITKINKNDRVLEIGPGGTPFPRSDVFLELKYSDEGEFRQQRGNTDPLVTEKPLIFYDGNKFPIDDQEFDYVICSHVIEHVQDVNQFLSEMFRVASKGYIEYPTIFYEYLYNFKMHLNFVKFNGKTLMYCRKEKTNLSQFLPVQSQFLRTFEMNYTCLVNQLQEYMFEGFEWETIFDFKETLDINDMVWADFNISKYIPTKENLLIRLLKKM
jgi:hypothetical protein